MKRRSGLYQTKRTDASSEDVTKRLDFETSKALDKTGSINNLQASYYLEVSKAVMASKDPVLYFVHPKIKIQQNEQWKKSLIFVIRFLKKYKMEHTIDTIKTEFPNVNQMIDLKNTNQNSILMDEIMSIAEDLGERTFSSRVAEFFNVSKDNYFQEHPQVETSQEYSYEFESMHMRNHSKSRFVDSGMFAPDPNEAKKKKYFK